MDKLERKMVQNLWMKEEIKVIVATKAFGMGINKPNVRFIIHDSMPSNLDMYIQEIGRGGRDGLPCDCLMFYNRDKERSLQNWFLQQIGSDIR